MVNLRGVPVLTVGMHCLDKKKFSGQGWKKPCCVRRRCKCLHVQCAEIKEVPLLQKVLQDLSGTIYNRDETHSPTSETSWSQSDTR